MNVWQQILVRLESRVSRHNFDTWLAPVRYSHVDADNTLHLVAPGQSAQEWLDREYRALVITTAQELPIGINDAVFSFEPNEPVGSVPRGFVPYQASLDFNASDKLFNPNYNFNSFVVGSCNEFAHAASRAVATNPARAYNPLYIYGGVGMGKTHLINAIGRQLCANFPRFRVVYVSSEQFMNEMVSSLRYNCMSTFHDRYRSADALLVDDIQTLQGKDGTQEEFFHTFNALHNMQKQIVISCDRPPKLVPGLVDRLRSRFEWGLMADIQAPDLETKMAILDRKAEAADVRLPDEVRSYLAMHMRSNIRELEGALIRLTALSSLTGTNISTAMAREALQSIGSSPARSVTIEGVQRAVAQEFELGPKQLTESTNARAIAFPRQVAMYLCKELTRASLPRIGRAFGKHHTTVLHSVTKIERMRQQDQDLNRLIHKLTNRFN